MPRQIKQITLETIKLIAHTLARQTMEWNEPLPEFETRFPNGLESCILVPFQTFGNNLLYKGLTEKAAVLFYLLIKNHPFQNGNKRIAVTTLLVFLSLNKKWLRIDTRALYSFSVWVAESRPEFKDEMIHAIEKFVRRNMVPLE